jgi:hypothetical protein
MLAGGVAVAAGIAIAVALFAADSFSGARAGEDATDLVRSELSAEGLAAHRQDFERVRDAVDELFDEALPEFADGLEMSEAELAADVARDYPSVAAYAPAERRAADFDFARKILENLERNRENFAQADRIPAGWLPITAGPVVAVGLATMLMLAGGLVLWRPRAAMLAVLLALGVSMVAGPFAFGFPQKADAAADLLESLTFTREIVTKTRTLYEDGKAAVRELTDEALPDLGEALGLGEAQLQALIAARYPAIAAASADLDGILQRYEHRVRIREMGLDVIPEAQGYPLRAVTSWAVVPGAVVALAAAAGLWAVRRARVRPSGA